MIAIPGAPDNKETSKEIRNRKICTDYHKEGPAKNYFQPASLGLCLENYDSFLIFIVNPPDGISLKSKTDFEETLLRLISTLPSLPS